MPELTKQPSRQLTDRECAKIIGGLLGGLANIADGKTIFAALDFQFRHRQHLENLYDAVFENEVKKGGVVPREGN